jgi:hypothetical protein
MDRQLVCTDLGRLPEVKTLLSRAVARGEIADGVALEFAGDDATARTVLEFILAERRCCALFIYEVRVTAGSGPVTLMVRASDADLEALKAMYTV